MSEEVINKIVSIIQAIQKIREIKTAPATEYPLEDRRIAINAASSDLDRLLGDADEILSFLDSLKSLPSEPLSVTHGQALAVVEAMYEVEATFSPGREENSYLRERDTRFSVALRALFPDLPDTVELATRLPEPEQEEHIVEARKRLGHIFQSLGNALLACRVQQPGPPSKRERRDRSPSKKEVVGLTNVQGCWKRKRTTDEG